MEYIEDKINLGTDSGRLNAIKFAKSMINNEKNVILKNVVIGDMFNILNSNENLSEFDSYLIENTIDALLNDYENLNFNDSRDIVYFSSDVNSNLGYIYSFYPHNL